MSFQKQYAQEIVCLGEDCALAADEAGECLIKQALQIYVGKERTRIANEAAVMDTYVRMFKDGRREPITFTNEPHYEDGRIKTIIEGV
jgi:hypothetical protein